MFLTGDQQVVLKMDSEKVIKPTRETENLMLTYLEQLFILPAVLFLKKRAIIRMFMFIIASLKN